jgi:microsomal dipeptidase-like Zn-dependent dipeptidase
VRSLPRLCQALLSRGWKPEAVRGLLGDNALRVLTAVLG